MKCKRLLAGLTAFSMILSAGSCGNEQLVRSQNVQTEITLSWWGNDTRTEYTLAAVRKFEQLHPEIKVKCNYSEWSGYEARSRIRMISDTEADVMQINVSWLSEFSEDGTGYYDLSKVSDVLDLSNFSEDYLRYGVRNGILNAVPIAMNTETVYFNKTIFDKYGLSLPETWDDLFAAAEVMSADGIYPLSGVAKGLWLYSIAYAEQKTGKTFFTENGEPGFSQDDYRTMIDFYVELVNKNVIPKTEDFKKISIASGAYAGTIAWVSDAVNYLGAAMDNGNEVIAVDYTAFDPADSGKGWYEKPATLYAMSKNTDHPKEAALLLDFMLNSKEWALLQGVEKGIPISHSALDYLEEAGMLTGLQYEASEVMANNLNLREMDPRLELTSVIDAFVDACDLVLYDKATADEAAAQFMAVCNESF